MTRVISKPGRFGACLLGMVALAVPVAASGALAQTVDAPKPQKSQKAQKPQAKSGEAGAAPMDRAQAEQAYANGVRAYDAGRLPEAVTALSTALMSGGLPNPQMARALYLRGTAYRKQGQAALAYTDLTSALWLKNGLAEPDKSKAAAEREAAHREAGLGNQAPPIPGADGAKSKTVSAPAAASPAAPKPGVDVASAPTNSSVLDALNPMNLFSSGTPKPAAQPQAPLPAAAAPVAAAPQVAAEPTVSSWSTTSSPPAQQAQAPAAAPAASYAEAAPQQTAAAPQDALSSATKAVTGFFGSVFGSSTGATATAQPSSPVMTASTAPVAAPQAVPMADPQAQGGAQAEGGSVAPWPNPDVQAAPEAAPAATGVQAQKKAAKTQMAAAVPGPQVQAIKPSAKGKYRLQVATVNTREEADKIAANVAGNPVISGAQPEVDSVVYGNMGTFFRVRVGPYATSAQPAELCKQLRPQGYDCLVVSN